MSIYALPSGKRLEWREAAETFIGLHAPGTVRQYRYTLRDFERFLGKDFINATESDVFEYTKSCTERPGQRSKIDPADIRCTKQTVHNKLETLSRISEHLRTLGITETNPFRGALEVLGHTQAGDKRPTGALTDDEVLRIFESLNTGALAGFALKESIRNKALISLLFGAGLRISEVLNLTLSDVCNSPGGTTYLRLRKTKSQKLQNHALQDWVALEVFKLMGQRTSCGATPEDFLFCVYYSDGRPKNKHVEYPTFRRWWFNMLKAAGLPTTATSHYGRATSITKMLSLGKSYREVQEFSRHSSIRCVELYDKRSFSLDNAPQKNLRYGKK